MQQTIYNKTIKILRHEATWLGLALCLYLLQAFSYAHHIEPTLDEGVYAYKGYLFLSGRYEPYQDYGPWTNKMPLSFIIPGAVQMLFGHGLASLRYYALILSVLVLLGLWLTARRFAGKKVAAGLVWVLALSPFTIELYSQGISQVLIAFMITWMLYFTLGPDRRPWQLGIGAVLAGLIFMTRENMAPAAAFLILYLIWEHGFKKAIPPILAFALVLVTVHALYWPGILRSWAPWIPRSISPFLDPWRYTFDGGRGSTVSFPAFAEKFYAFWHAVYLHFSLWAGVIAGIVLWPWKRMTTKVSKAFIFLLVMFLFLLTIHADASIGGRFCIFCFENYLGFFAPVGYLLIVVSFSQWQAENSFRQRLSAAFIIPLLYAGWGYASARFIGPWLLARQVPRMRDLHFLPGKVELWQLAANKFGWSYDFQKVLFPTLVGAAAGLIIILAAALACQIGKKKNWHADFAYISLVLFFIMSVLITPAIRLDAVSRNPPCEEDVLTAYQRTGDFLAEVITEDALVYWEGAPVAELLYLPDVRIFPPQLNQNFSFILGGTPDLLYRYGFWNASLAEEWIALADYVVVGDESYSQEFAEAIAAQPLEAIQAAQPDVGCKAGSRLRIFRRK